MKYKGFLKPAAVFLQTASVVLFIYSPAFAASVTTSADFASNWNAGASPITVVGTQINSAGDYGIILTNSLNAFGGAVMSVDGGATPDGAALYMNAQTLSFSPGWNNALTATLTNLSIYNAQKGAVAFAGNGIGDHYLTITGTYFYNNANASGSGGAVNVNSQQQNAVDNIYTLTNNDFISNSAVNGGAVYMAANNTLYSGSPGQFIVQDLSGSNAHYIALNNAGGNGGGIYFMGNNANGGTVGNQFSATGYNYYQNAASGYGGAIYTGVLNGNNPNVNVFTLTGGIFTQNQAASGGAVASQINGGSTDITLTLTGKFYSNTAAQNGGAVYNAVGDSGSSPSGGHINISITGPFDSNRAASGGAIYNNLQPGQSTVVTNISSAQQPDGSGGFTNNYASSNGGAIYNNAGNNNPGTAIVNIADGTLFYSNGAGGQGGAVYNGGNGVINLLTDTNSCLTSGNCINFVNNYTSSYSSGADIYQAGSNAKINITGSGTVNINDGIAGAGTINQGLTDAQKQAMNLTALVGTPDSTNLNLNSGSQSFWYKGTFNQMAGNTLTANGGTMFGGANNIGGTANITSSAIGFYFNANMLSNSTMNYYSTASSKVNILAANDVTGAAGISFAGSGAKVNFNADPSQSSAIFNLAGDIYNHANQSLSNTIEFNNSTVTFGSTNYNHGTVYNFLNSSVIDLASSNAETRTYTFGSLGLGSTANALLDTLNIKAIGGASGAANYTTDQLALNYTGAANDAITLGKIYVSNDATALNGKYQVLINNTPAKNLELSLGSGGSMTISTSSNIYTVTLADTATTNDSIIFGSTSNGTKEDPTDPGSGTNVTLDLNDVNAVTAVAATYGVTKAARAWQISSYSDGGVYYNPLDDGNNGHGDVTTNPPGTSGLNVMAGGIFNVYGETQGSTENILSGQFGSSGSGVYLSLFNIDSTNNNYSGSVTFGLSDLTVQNAFINGSGSVLRMNDASSTVNINDVFVWANTSAASGGAVNASAGTINISDSWFVINTAATGDGGALDVLSGASVYLNNVSFGDGTITPPGLSPTACSALGFTCANTAASGRGGAIYNAGNLVVQGGSFYYNGAANGGAIYNDASSANPMYIFSAETNQSNSADNTLYFSGNAATGSGGAIYNNGDMTIVASQGADIVFQNNSIVNNLETRTVISANDIYNAGTINLASTGGNIDIYGGVSGSAAGIINKDGLAVLNLKSTADNSAYLGKFNMANGVVNADGAFFGGLSMINTGTLNWNTGASKTAASILEVVSGSINIYGGLTLANALDVIGPASTLNLFSSGYYDIQGGTVFLSTTDMLVNPVDGSYGYAMQSDGYLVNGGQDMFVYTGAFRQTGGVSRLENGATAYLNSNSSYYGLFGGDLVVTNATVLAHNYELNYGVGVGTIIPTTGTLAMGDGALFDSIDGALQTHNFAGKFALFTALGGGSTTVNFAVDLDAQAHQSDILVFAQGTAAAGDTAVYGNNHDYGSGGAFDNAYASGGVLENDVHTDFIIPDVIATGGTVMLTNINFLTTPTETVVPFRIMDTQGTADASGIMFGATMKEYKTAIYTYSLESLGEGNYQLVMQAVNPDTGRGQASVLAMMSGQLIANNILFDHVFFDSNVMLETGCNYRFLPSQFLKENRQKNLWAKSYYEHGSLPLSRDISVKNDMYGYIMGLDFTARDIGGDAYFMPTVYAGYTGARQTYGSINMDQNAAQAGVMLSLMKGEYTASGMVYGGAYQNNMNAYGFKDDVYNWFAGAALKNAYNIYLDNLVLQPYVQASYNIYGKQSWQSSYGNISMESGFMNGASVAPGLSMIYGLRTWNFLLTGSYVFNVGGKISGKAAGVSMEDLEREGDYFEYGAGVSKFFTKDFNVWAKAIFKTNRGEDYGFRLGAGWRF